MIMEFDDVAKISVQSSIDLDGYYRISRKFVFLKIPVVPLQGSMKVKNSFSFFERTTHVILTRIKSKFLPDENFLWM